ncbi:MAG TPA: ABC transporter permease [Candidatus Ventrimonas merdavium]|nr:ABC transporter permease [Candidatus Ventrimonas merdavium]
MMIFLEFKERLKSFYGRYATLANGLIKFVFSFSALWMMSQNIGFQSRLVNPIVLAVLALICAVLPYGAIACLLAVVMLAHLYAVSMEVTLITAVFLILVALLYYGFQPGDSYWLVLVPMAFFLKIPFAVALLAGLSAGIITVIPVSCGIVIYYMLAYVKQNAGVLTNDASVDITQKFLQIIQNLVSNQTMLVMIGVCAVGVLVVYLVRTMSVDYAWTIAVVVGTIAQLGAAFAGDYLLGVTLPVTQLLVGALLSALLAGVYHFFVFAVDYTRTEYTQFEDDDYVYYVKAVPKVAVSKPEVRVQRINNPVRRERPARR